MDYVAGKSLVPPIPLTELLPHAENVLKLAGMNSQYRDFAAILLNNELWRDSLAAVPFNRRLLLLPKCLRASDQCRATFDEFGLLCKECGLCSINDLQKEAERLGYVVLVAEGSALVMALLQKGKVDAIVGVSCHNVLEKAFPYMESAAIPGMAIPLLQDGCIDTTVDLDWVWEILHLNSEDKSQRLDLTALREEVDRWFTLESLDEIMGPANNETEKLGRYWLGKAGKRWRPFLTAATYVALQNNNSIELPDEVKKAAVAVECFHKASLIHDDIEDGDDWRYGDKTLHKQHGIPVALNIGDLLIGEGYRMISLCGISPSKIAKMLSVAAEGQRTLCLGQGSELAWIQLPRPLSSKEVIDIFRRKTAPAFEVSILLGAICHDVNHNLSQIIHQYSEALGIAYQIRDDLEDWGGMNESNDLAALRPSLMMALAHENSLETQKSLWNNLWQRILPAGNNTKMIEEMYRQYGIDAQTRHILEAFKAEAIRSLAEMHHPSLKCLLRRVIGKIFNTPEIRGWCHDSALKSAGQNNPPPE